MVTMKQNYIILFFILLMAVSFISCKEQKVAHKKNIDNSAIGLIPDQISWDVKVTFIDSSYTKAILYAKRARIYQKKKETLLDSGIKVLFLSKTTGATVSTLTADSARIDDESKNMLAFGKVVVVSDSTKTTLETSLLEWNNASQKLYSTEFVKITSPEETIKGVGFESDQNLNNYKIFKVKSIENKSILKNKSKENKK